MLEFTPTPQMKRCWVWVERGAGLNHSRGNRASALYLRGQEIRNHAWLWDLWALDSLWDPPAVWEEPAKVTVTPNQEKHSCSTEGILLNQLRHYHHGGMHPDSQRKFGLDGGVEAEKGFCFSCGSGTQECGNFIQRRGWEPHS